MKKPRIGFIGQGWIGKNYADDFEKRGYEVVRYALESQFVGNKENIAMCDIVFIAVPTPTTPQGFDDSHVRAVLSLVGKGKIAVIKSTLLPGRTNVLAEAHQHCLVMHSPEFLSEKTASYDAAHPDRNIVGIPNDSKEFRAAAQNVLDVLPKAPYELVCPAETAELIKYGHNIHGYIQIVFSNIMYDLGASLGVDWEVLKSSFMADPMMSHSYLNPVHKSGRGAGGGCFIKDFEAFIEVCRTQIGNDQATLKALEAIRDKNLELLRGSQKDLGLLRGVYGDINSAAL